MPAGRPQGPNDPSLISSLEMALRDIPRPSAAEIAWRWRWEAAIVVGLGGLSALIATSIGLAGLAAAAGAGLAAGAALLCWPPARQRIVAQAWCFITPHRILAGCANAWVQTRRGRLPIILSAAPAPYGERLRLWLRAGLTAADLHATRDVLAVACWATEVRVVPCPRRAHLVILEVIRKVQPERMGPAPQAWPYSRRVEGDRLDDPEERDSVRQWWEPIR